MNKVFYFEILQATFLTRDEEMNLRPCQKERTRNFFKFLYKSSINHLLTKCFAIVQSEKQYESKSSQKHPSIFTYKKINKQYFFTKFCSCRGSCFQDFRKLSYTKGISMISLFFQHEVITWNNKSRMARDFWVKTRWAREDSYPLWKKLKIYFWRNCKVCKNFISL